MTGKSGNKITFTRTYDVPMTELEVRKARSILVNIMARAYAAEHPEQFGPYLDRVFENSEDE